MAKKISPTSLYVVQPSKLINVEGEFEKIAGAELVHQTATFEQREQLSIAEVSTMDNSLYKDIFEKRDESFYEGRPCLYYSAQGLNSYGISISQKQKDFVDVFEDDIIPLSDFVFGLENNGLMRRLRYFKHPFRSESMELKEKVHLERLINGKDYTIDELCELQDTLKTIARTSRREKRHYSVVREPVKRALIHGNFFKVSRQYAGTSDDCEHEFAKSLRSRGNLRI